MREYTEQDARVYTTGMAARFVGLSTDLITISMRMHVTATTRESEY
jgi:hypothetical protein